MKRILLIEDDEALRKTLTIALEAEGFSVVSAADGRQGLDLGLKEKADLIALDMVLPFLGGLEVCRGLRENKVMTPIIMLSGQKKEEVDKVLGLELGADDYLLKPFGPREFLAESGPSCAGAGLSLLRSKNPPSGMSRSISRDRRRRRGKGLCASRPRNSAFSSC